MTIEPIAWDSDRLHLLDQTRLPIEEVWLELTDHHGVAEAISSMRVRGAPAIGVAAAYGIALAALSSAGPDLDGLIADLRSAADQLIATRPTGANLSWAVERALAEARAAGGTSPNARGGAFSDISLDILGGSGIYEGATGSGACSGVLIGEIIGLLVGDESVPLEINASVRADCTGEMATSRQG